MKLIAYNLQRDPPPIRPATLERKWMDETPEKFAYRCLPLNIANYHGWEIYTPYSFSAVWNGEKTTNAITIKSDAPSHYLPLSHFGSGVLTFHVNVLIRTEPGYNLWVSGPPNNPKDGISALTGIIETDWAPYSFTMNWLFTTPYHEITFDAGEAISFFFPIPRGLVEAQEPEFRNLNDDPETKAAYEYWSKSRSTFNAELAKGSENAVKQKWQKNYFQGAMPDSGKRFDEHQTKIKVPNFIDKQSK